MTDNKEDVDHADVHGAGHGDGPAGGGSLASDGGSAGDEAPGTNQTPAPRRSTVWPWVREMLAIVVGAAVLSVLIKTFLVQSFSIPSESMESTLNIGDRVMVSRLVPRVFDVHRGDIVVFKDPGGWLGPVEPEDHGPVINGARSALTFVGLLPQDAGEHVIKRVIGVAGDHVACCTADGKIAVNGVAITEPYLNAGAIPSQLPFDVVVPHGKLFVLGDNRQHSGDSRLHLQDANGGFVPLSNVVGTAFVKNWPLFDLGLIRNPGAVFEKVPEP